MINFCVWSFVQKLLIQSVETANLVRFNLQRLKLVNSINHREIHDDRDVYANANDIQNLQVSEIRDAF